MTERLITLMLTGLVGGLIASFADHGLQARKGGWYRRIALGLFGFAISIAAVEPFFVAVHLEHLERRFGWLDENMAETSVYYGAQRQVAATSGLVRVVLGKRVENVEKELANVAKRQSIHISGEEVTNTWRDIVEHADRCICATNVVAKKEWSEVGNDDGVALQISAMKSRHVSIVRVFLPDEKLPVHAAQLRALAERQRAAKIDVHEIGLGRVVENASYDKARQELNATDVVVADDSLALLTQTDPVTHELIGAMLTSDPETVKAAKEYVLRVLSDAQGVIPPRCK